MDQSWWQVLLDLINSWMGAKTVWMPSVGAIATVTGIVQVVKKLMRLAPFLDKFTGGLATIVLSAVTAGLVVLVPSLDGGLQVSEIIATIIAVLGSAGLYEVLVRLFRKSVPTP